MINYDDEAAIRILEQIQVNFKYDDIDQNFKFSLMANALLNNVLTDKISQRMNPEEDKNQIMEPQDNSGILTPSNLTQMLLQNYKQIPFANSENFNVPLKTELHKVEYDQFKEIVVLTTLLDDKTLKQGQIDSINLLIFNKLE